MNKVIASLMIFFGSAVYAESMKPLTADEQSEVTTRLSDVAKKTGTISSSFLQTKNLSVLSEKIKSSGYFYFKKENLIRWEYVKPYKYILIFSGSRVTINDGVKTNRFDANANRIFQQINNTVLASMKGEITDSPDFSLSFFKTRNRYIVKLTPKAEELLKYISVIDIHFDNRNYTVVEVNLYEKSGDYTNIIFTNREFNKPLPEKLFTAGN